MIPSVLFLCTGNSARSIMAEVLLKSLGGGRFRSFSAGSHPRGRVHPLAIETLSKQGYDTAGVRSKDWGEFSAAGAPPIDFVITLCDEAAGEPCPLFPGRAVRAHWGLEDPARAQGSAEDQRRAFREALALIRRRVQAFTSLPFDSVDPRALQSLIAEIGDRDRETSR
jgi:arsenate reductase